MDVRLSAARIRSITACNALLLTYPSYDTFEGWLNEALASIRTLGKADCALAVHLGHASIASNGRAVDDLKSADYLFRQSEGARRMLARHDPLWTKREMVGSAWHAYLDSEDYQEFFEPNRFLDGAGYIVRNGTAPTVVGLFASQLGSLSDDPELHASLRLVLPAFAKSAEHARTVAGWTTSAIATDEALRRATLLISPSGSIVHRTSAADRLIKLDPHGDRVSTAAVALARHVMGAIGRAGAEVPLEGSAGELTGDRTCVTPAARYALHAAFVAARDGGPAHVLVDLQRNPAAAPTELELSRRGLTPRELEACRLVLLGHKAPAIASRLGVAKGTAEAHLESIKRKLGATSQQELLLILAGLKPS